MTRRNHRTMRDGLPPAQPPAPPAAMPPAAAAVAAAAAGTAAAGPWSRLRAVPRLGVGLGLGLTWLPLLLGPNALDTAILTALYVTLAVAFDLVVGRVGALSLAQALFLGFGAYAAALLSIHIAANGWLEAAAAASGGALLALLIGIPSFRLSFHSFAIGTLGFGLIGSLIATNWISVTGGPLCTTNVPPLTLPYPGGAFTALTLQQLYLVIAVIAWLAVTLIWLISRSTLGLAYTAVRDDPILAGARGLWPNQLRISAFMISGAVTAIGGVFLAHYIGVVCPTQFDFSTTLLLVIIVFVGGRASLSGVISAAVVFTVLPQVLRLTDRWRIVLLSLTLLALILYKPQGLEALWRGRGTRLKATARRAAQTRRAKARPHR
jgi:ABC-type branched-subunit amino acid transport system permease subunit